MTSDEADSRVSMQTFTVDDLDRVIVEGPRWRDPRWAFAWVLLGLTATSALMFLYLAWRVVSPLDDYSLGTVYVDQELVESLGVAHERLNDAIGYDSTHGFDPAPVRGLPGDLRALAADYDGIAAPLLDAAELLDEAIGADDRTLGRQAHDLVAGVQRHVEAMAAR